MHWKCFHRCDMVRCIDRFAGRCCRVAMLPPGKLRVEMFSGPLYGMRMT